MSDVAAPIADSAPLPDVGGAPIDGGNLSPQPLGSQIPPEAQTDKPSLDESLDRAIAKAEEEPKPEPKDPKAAPAKVDPNAPKKVEQQPRENGKFAPRQGEKALEARPGEQGQLPKWIKPEETQAQADWAKTPKSIQEASARREQEYEAGIVKHSQRAEAVERELEPLRPFVEMARQSGKELHHVVNDYVGMENYLRQDLVGGLDTICQRLGVSLRDVASHILGQPADAQASQQDATIRELRGQLEQIQQQVGSVTQTFQHQQASQVGKEVADFAAAHPRFDELHEDIAFFLKTRTNDLSEAYDLAERLNPASGQQAPRTAPSTSAPSGYSAQTDKGQKSIAGSPSAGSTPGGKKRPSLSIDESLDRAFGAL